MNPLVASETTPAVTSLRDAAARLQQALPSAPLVTTLGRQATVTFRLDPDMLGACEDQAQNMGISLAVWMESMLNEALKSYLGV